MATTSSNPDDLLFAEIRRALRPRDGDPAADATPPGNQPVLNQVGNFRIVRELHRGGQGIVYEAVQQNPERRVALKVLLHGIFSSERQRFRFDREINWIAALNHPNIVTVYDSGFVEGQPFYAMEFIDGAPLDQDSRFARPTDATARESRDHIHRCLELLETICSAVTCFQQHGLIHRDLKPGNILVDQDGHPHVLDFGLARLVDESRDDSSDPRFHTRSGEFLGTLGYAAPEQLSGRPVTVDARSDVYALGVILYELLVGALPHDGGESTAALIQRICNEDAAAPSNRNPATDRDVDTIVLKALAREPQRRYQSAEQLADDLRRYLSGRPIEARRDSALYVLHRTVRRHWAAVLGAFAFVILLVAGTVISFSLWQQAEKRLDRAVRAEAAADAARLEESRQRREAEFNGSVASLAAALAAVRDYQVIDAYDHLHRVPELLRDFEWWYVLSRIDTSIGTWQCGASGLHVLTTSSDGRQIAVGGRSGSIRVLDAESGKQLLARDGVGAVGAMAYHPTADTLLLGMDDGRLRELNLADNTWRRDLDPMPAAVTALAVSPDGERFAVAAGPFPSPVVAFAIRDYESDSEIASDTTRAYSLAVSPDGTRIAVGGDEVTIRNVQTGQILATADRVSDRSDHVVFSPSGDRVISAHADKTVRVLNGETLTEEKRFPVQKATTRALAIGPEGGAIATGAADGTVRLWDIESGESLKVFWGQTGWAIGVAFLPRGTTILSLDPRGTIKLWAATADVGDFVTRGHGSVVNDVQFSSTGEFLATASFDARIKLWDVDTGQHLRTLNGHSTSVNDIDFSADDRLLASASTDRTIRIWDVETGRNDRLRGHDDEVLCVAFSPDDAVLGSGSKDGTTRLWNVESRNEVTVMNSDRDQPIRWIDFLPEDRLITEQVDAIEVWSIADGTLDRRWDIDGNPWWATTALHPNGTQLAVGQTDGRIRLWDVDSGEESPSFEWHALNLTALAFNPDGTRLIAASSDGAVKVWHVERRVEMLSLPARDQVVPCLDFSPDGRRVAAGLYDGNVVWWEAIPPHQRLAPRFARE